MRETEKKSRNMTKRKTKNVSIRKLKVVDTIYGGFF